MLPWKTSRVAARVLVQLGVQQAPAGTPLPRGTPPAPPLPHHGPRHLQQKRPGKPCVGPGRPLKQGVPPSWARWGLCKERGAAGCRLERDPRAGAPIHGWTHGGCGQRQAGPGVTVCLLWGAFRQERTPRVRLARWVLPGSGAAGGRGSCWTCTEGDGSRPALLLRVVAPPRQHPASLEHPAGLEHPICIHLGASRWPQASHAPQVIPSASVLRHPIHLGHPIHFGTSHQPGSTPVSWEHPMQPWQSGSACAHPCLPPHSRAPRPPCHEPPARCPSGQRHPCPPIPASLASAAEQAPKGVGLQGEGCPILLPASLGLLQGCLWVLHVGKPGALGGN